MTDKDDMDTLADEDMMEGTEWDPPCAWAPPCARCGHEIEAHPMSDEDYLEGGPCVIRLFDPQDGCDGREYVEPLVKDGEP